MRVGVCVLGFEGLFLLGGCIWAFFGGLRRIAITGRWKFRRMAWSIARHMKIYRTPEKKQAAVFVCLMCAKSGRRFGSSLQISAIVSRKGNLCIP